MFKITGRKSDMEMKEILLHKKQDFPFEHNYEILNNGPSPTNRYSKFSLFIPLLVVNNAQDKTKKVDASNLLKFIPASDPNVECKKRLDGTVVGIQNIPEGDIHISCKNHDCIIYDCNVFDKWEKGERHVKRINLKMKVYKKLFLKGQLKDFDEFFIWTAMAMSDDSGDKTYTTYETKFVSNRSGNWRARIAEFWPIVIGLFIVIVVFSSILYALFKTGSFKKLRFYNTEKMEREHLVTERVSRRSSYKFRSID